MKGLDYGVYKWLDKVSAVWSEVVVDDIRVESYKLSKIPESVTKVPVAISFVPELDPAYAKAGNAIGSYSGETQLHLTKSLVMSQLPYVMRFMDPVVAAAASHITLWGEVFDFRVQKVEVVTLRWGGEEDHFGLKISWTVQETQTGKFAIRA